MRRAWIGFAALAFGLFSTRAVAEQAKSLREQIVGSWIFAAAEVTAPDGKKSFPFGETPKGILIFTPDGRFAQIHVASDVTYRIVSSTFPNWEGEAQTRTIDKLTADEFVNTNPNVAGGRGSAANYYKRAK